jgi:hypothetical protein
MPSILDSLSGVLGDDAVRQIGQQLGTDPATTSSAISSALPMLVTALAHQTSSEGGADALAGALASHDGSALDDLSGILGGGGGGGDLLGQVLGGGKAGALTSMLGQSSGLGQQGARQLLGMLAPLVMGAIGKNMRAGGLDSTGLAGMLGAEHQQIASSNAPLASMLTQALDSNHDGSVVDDVMRIAGGLFGGSK